MTFACPLALQDCCAAVGRLQLSWFQPLMQGACLVYAVSRLAAMPQQRTPWKGVHKPRYPGSSSSHSVLCMPLTINIVGSSCRLTLKTFQHHTCTRARQPERSCPEAALPEPGKLLPWPPACAGRQPAAGQGLRTAPLYHTLSLNTNNKNS